MLLPFNYIIHLCGAPAKCMHMLNTCTWMYVTVHTVCVCTYYHNHNNNFGAPCHRSSTDCQCHTMMMNSTTVDGMPAAGILYNYHTMYNIIDIQHV